MNESNLQQFSANNVARFIKLVFHVCTKVETSLIKCN